MLQCCAVLSVQFLDFLVGCCFAVAAAAAAAAAATAAADARWLLMVTAVLLCAVHPQYDNCNANTDPKGRYPVMRDALNATGRPILFSSTHARYSA